MRKIEGFDFSKCQSTAAVFVEVLVCKRLSEVEPAGDDWLSYLNLR
jgi:hypothetical protein